MQTILDILRKAGGWHHGLYLRIENPPHMALVIEATDESGHYVHLVQLHEQHQRLAATLAELFSIPARIASVNTASSNPSQCGPTPTALR